MTVLLKNIFIQYIIVSEIIYGEVRLHAVGSQFRFSLTRKKEILIALIKNNFFSAQRCDITGGVPFQLLLIK